MAEVALPCLQLRMEPEARVASWEHEALVCGGRERHARCVFCVTEAEAAAIRAVYLGEGELTAAIELRRLFPSIPDNAQARVHARMIAGWQPLPAHPLPSAAVQGRARRPQPK